MAVRDPPSPIRVLVTAGWLTGSDAGDPRLRVDETASSHALFRVTAPDGRRVVVKQVRRDAVAVGRTLARELFVYRLANWIPAVAAALPAAELIDEKHQILVMESLGTGGAWPSVEASRSIGSPDVARELGTLMAGWHHGTQEVGLWPSPAIGILHLPEALAEAAEGRPLATQALMRALVDDPEFSNALREARGAWRDRCLIHGDIRRENWIATRAGRSTAVKVLDWELSGSGDPAWDLASVLAEATLDTIRERYDSEFGWSRTQELALHEFFRSYLDNGGLLEARDSREWDHVILCGVARLLHVACEWADLQTDIESGPSPSVVAHARGLLQHRADLVRAWSSARWSRP